MFERWERARLSHLAGLSAGLMITLVLGAPAPAQARLGEDFQAYKQRVANSYKLLGEKASDKGTTYQFSVKLDEKPGQASPGYALGVTIATEGGKISQQVMTVHPGANPIPGGLMAAIHAFAFSWEAIGKPLPASKEQGDVQFKPFSGAVTAAFLGNAQNVRYPGYSGLITLRRDGAGNLTVTVRK